MSRWFVIRWVQMCYSDTGEKIHRYHIITSLERNEIWSVHIAPKQWKRILLTEQNVMNDCIPKTIVSTGCTMICHWRREVGFPCELHHGRLLVRRRGKATIQDGKGSVTEMWQSWHTVSKEIRAKSTIAMTSKQQYCWCNLRSKAAVARSEIRRILSVFFSRPIPPAAEGSFASVGTNVAACCQGNSSVTFITPMIQSGFSNFGLPSFQIFQQFENNFEDH